MDIHLIGHAAMIINMKSSKILVDPVLSWIGSLLLVNQNAQPPSGVIEDLSINEVDLGQTIRNLDVVIYTNSHVENHAKRAFKKLANSVPILCHPRDNKRFDELGFRNIVAVSEPFKVKDISITSAGKTQNNVLLKVFQSVHGFIIEAPNEPKIFLAGISKWNLSVRNVIEQTKPDLTIFSANALQNSSLKSTSSSSGYLKQLKKQMPNSMMLVMNMESGNHCLLAKKNLDIIIKDNVCKINL